MVSRPSLSISGCSVKQLRQGVPRILQKKLNYLLTVVTVGAEPRKGNGIVGPGSLIRRYTPVYQYPMMVSVQFC